MPNETIKSVSKLSYKFLGFGVGGIGLLLSITFGILGFHFKWVEQRPEFLYVFFSTMVSSLLVIITGSIIQYKKKENRNKRVHIEKMEQFKLEQKEQKNEISNRI